MNTNLLRWTSAFAFATIAAVSFSQGIRPFRTLSTGPATVMATSDFSPQINPRFEFVGRPLSPNSPPVTIPPGVSNMLQAGGVTSKLNNSLGTAFPGIGFTGWVPPDPNIAVGPNHIVSVVNSDVAFFNKSTGLKTFQQPGDGTGFFSGIGVATTFVFDPKCYYDKLSGRFFVLFLEADFENEVSKVLLALSDDSDPNGTWYKYRIEAKITEGSNSFWLDYPGFGVNKDAVVFSGNMFPFGTGGVFTSIAVIPKTPLLTGGTANVSYIKDTTMFTFQPARTADAAQSNMYGCAVVSSTGMRISAITNLLTTPTLLKTDVPIPAWARPSAVPAGGGKLLDGLDGRLYTAHLRNGRMVASHTIKAPDGRMAARWYEFAMNSWPSTGQPILRQSGNVLLTNTNTHMPAVNINAVGDISVLYSRSNGSTNPETCVSSRLATDPLGTVGTPQVLGTSAASYGGSGVNRWGDYFTVEIDPTDNVTFWGIGMVADASGNWTTHINKWTVSSAAASFVNPFAVSPIQGTFQSGNLASVTASDNLRYTMESVLIDRNGQPTSSGSTAIGQSASVRFDFDLDLSGGPLTDLKAVVESHVSPSGATGQLFAFNWTTGTYVSIGSFSQGTTDRTATILIPAASLGSYVDASGGVRLLVRAFYPVRSGRLGVMPPVFDFNIDRVALSPTFNTP